MWYPGYIQSNDLHDMRRNYTQEILLAHDQLATGYSDEQEARNARWLYRRFDNMFRDG